MCNTYLYSVKYSVFYALNPQFRTEYQRRNEYKRLMMPNGPYGIRGDCSLFEHPGRLSSNFDDCRITLGDRYLIRSYIEAYYHCGPSQRLFVYKSELTYMY